MNIQGTPANYANMINQSLYNAVASPKENAGAQQVTAEQIFNKFFKGVRSKDEFKKKIRKTLSSINDNLSDEDIDSILGSLEAEEQPPFCASYSEEGVSEKLELNDNLMRSDLYDVFLMFYQDIYGEAAKKIG
ncbi:MAG: hypothetical protein PHF25_07450 [Candidatus Margulisbacteria bacterium]|nr:hypothetical protein [Candidatus Margulisiibacteriota bacterium]